MKTPKHLLQYSYRINGTVVSYKQTFDDYASAKRNGIETRKYFVRRNGDAIGYSYAIKRNHEGRYAFYDNE